MILEYLIGPSAKDRDPKRGFELALSTAKEFADDPRAHHYLAAAVFLSRAQMDATTPIQAAAAKGGDPACTEALLGLDALYTGQQENARQHFARFAQLVQQDRGNRYPLRAVLWQMVNQR